MEWQDSPQTRGATSYSEQIEPSVHFHSPHQKLDWLVGGDAASISSKNSSMEIALNTPQQANPQTSRLHDFCRVAIAYMSLDQSPIPQTPTSPSTPVQSRPSDDRTNSLQTQLLNGPWKLDKLAFSQYFGAENYSQRTFVDELNSFSKSGLDLVGAVARIKRKRDERIVSKTRGITKSIVIQRVDVRNARTDYRNGEPTNVVTDEDDGDVYSITVDTDKANQTSKMNSKIAPSTIEKSNVAIKELRKKRVSWTDEIENKRICLRSNADIEASNKSRLDSKPDKYRDSGYFADEDSNEGNEDPAAIGEHHDKDYTSRPITSPNNMTAMPLERTNSLRLSTEEFSPADSIVLDDNNDLQGDSAGPETQPSTMLTDKATVQERERSTFTTSNSTDCLKDGNWLSATVLAEILSWFETKELKIYDPSFVSVDNCGTELTSEKRLPPIIDKSIMQVVVPLFHDYHWTVCIFDLDRGVGTHYDSLGNGQTRHGALERFAELAFKDRSLAIEVKEQVRIAMSYPNRGPGRKRMS